MLNVYYEKNSVIKKVNMLKIPILKSDSINQILKELRQNPAKTRQNCTKIPPKMWNISIKIFIYNDSYFILLDHI